MAGHCHVVVMCRLASWSTSLLSPTSQAGRVLGTASKEPAPPTWEKGVGEPGRPLEPGCPLRRLCPVVFTVLLSFRA